MEDLKRVEQIARDVAAVGGRALIVGGYARDEVLRQQGHDVESKDVDVEVYNTPLDELMGVLSLHGQIDTVGASFGVIKMKGTEIDVSLPRRDSKSGNGHRGFIVDTDPHMSFHEAARRRDFTINTLALDPLTHEVIDEWGGANDLRDGVLRATDAELFKDDPLRVLRAMQFAARFHMTLDPATAELCRSIPLDDLAAERVGEEWKKLLLKSDKPSIGLEVANQIGVLAKLHPELDVLQRVPQDPAWHPEGSVWEHTKLAVDVASRVARREGLDEDKKLELLLASLCHDIGKRACTTTNEQGRIISHGHEELGVDLARRFLASLALPANLRRTVLALVRCHMFFSVNPNPSDAALRRLSVRLAPATITQLAYLTEADQHGRTAEPQKDLSFLSAALDRAVALQVAREKPTPLIQGRDLIDLGVVPGPGMGQVLKTLLQYQLDGAITTKEEAIAQAQQLLQQQ